jgi:hypothetical protein
MQENSTIPGRVPFEDEMDRRTSPRIPIFAPIKLGPPKDEVCSELTLEDLSLGGMFIQCPEPVQVGAKFSAELSLPDGRAVYVPEVEVRYNRSGEEERSSGFGAEFVNLPPEVQAKLADATAYAVPSTRGVSESMIVYSESELSGQVPEDELDAPDTLQPQLAVPRISDLRLASLRPATLRSKLSRIDGWSVKVERPAAEPEAPEPVEHCFDTDSTFIRADRADPSWDVAVEQECQEAVDEPSVDDEPTVDVPAPSASSEVGDDEFDLDNEPFFLSDTPARAEEAKAPVDSIDALRHELLLSDEAFPARSSKTRRGHRAWLGFFGAGVVAAVLTVAVTQSSDHSQTAFAQGSNAETNGLSAETHNALLGKQSMARDLVPRGTPVVNTSERAVVRKLPPLVELNRPRDESPKQPQMTAKSAEKIASIGPAKPASKNRRAGALSLAVSPQTKVRRSFVMKNPARFVMDLEGLSAAPKLPAPRGAVRAVRVGRHPGYTRIVFDSARAIKRARITEHAGRLDVRIEH